MTSKQRWLACSTLVVVWASGCSPALDNSPRGGEDDGDLLSISAGKLRFPNQELAVKQKAAKAAPQKFDPVFDYARAVTVFCQASLVDTDCAACADGEIRYKPRSDLNPHYWPVIEDVLSLLDPLMEAQGLEPEQMEQLVATKGRLLWLAGRSTEEENLIDEYARRHPDAVSVVKRRLELLRENSDATGVESQCSRSRNKMKSSPEAARLELLTSCVALHPGNRSGSEARDFGTYLPNLAPDEEGLYRSHLVQRCVEDLGDDESRCGEACACDKATDKASITKCKRACQGCRADTEQQVRGCKTLATPSTVAGPAPARARVPRPKSPPVVRPKASPAAAPAARPKEVDDGSGPKQAVL